MRETVTEGFDALDMSESVALIVPTVVGEKITERFAEAPAFNVKGNVSPLIVKPLPFTVAEEMVRLDAPVFERVIGRVWLLPTITVPRFMLEGALK